MTLSHQRQRSDIPLVDRILRQQKADRLAAEEAARAKAGAALVSQPGASSSSDTLVSQASKPDGKLGGAPSPKDALIDHNTPILPEKSVLKPRPVSQMLNNMFRRGKGDDAASIAGPSDAPPLPSKDRASGENQLPLLPPPRPDRPRTPNPHATPRSSIGRHWFFRVIAFGLTPTS